MQDVTTHCYCITAGLPGDLRVCVYPPSKGSSVTCVSLQQSATVGRVWGGGQWLYHWTGWSSCIQHLMGISLDRVV